MRITCDMTAFGCCPDGETIANGFSDEGCPPTTTATTATASSTRTMVTTTSRTRKTDEITSRMTTTADVRFATVTLDKVKSEVASSRPPSTRETSHASSTSRRPRKGCRRRTTTTAATSTAAAADLGSICRKNCCVIVNRYICVHESDFQQRPGLLVHFLLLPKRLFSSASVSSLVC